MLIIKQFIISLRECVLKLVGKYLKFYFTKYRIVFIDFLKFEYYLKINLRNNIVYGF